MPTEIDEPINVGAVFSRGAIKPVWFSWNGREIRIREVTFTWKTQEGNAGLLHFSVTDGQGLYEVVFNKATMGWRILSAE
jgi:hypothetical protein